MENLPFGETDLRTVQKPDYDSRLQYQRSNKSDGHSDIDEYASILESKSFQNKLKPKLYKLMLRSWLSKNLKEVITVEKHQVII